MNIRWSRYCRYILPSLPTYLSIYVWAINCIYLSQTKHLFLHLFHRLCMGCPSQFSREKQKKEKKKKKRKKEEWHIQQKVSIL